MKVTKWEQYDEIHGIQELEESDDGESNLSVYPLCRAGNYEVYPCTSLLKDTYYLSSISKAALAKHEEVVSKSDFTREFPFILIDKTDRDWYADVMMKELVDKKETIPYIDCIEQMMRRRRKHFYLRTMWRWDSCNKECVGVLKDELIFLLPFVLKQQGLNTKKNSEKLRKINKTMEYSDDCYGVIPVFSLSELTEVLEMFNINKEIFVLIPDYHLCYDLLNTSGSPIAMEYDTTYGKAHEATDEVWLVLQSFGTMCDWSDILGRESKDFQSLRVLHALVFKSIITWFGKKNFYVSITYVINIMKQINIQLKLHNVATIHHSKVKYGDPRDLIEFRTFIDHPMVKLGQMFSERDREKLCSANVERWRIYVAIMLVAIERLLKNDHPDLKELLTCRLRKEIIINAPSSDVSLQDFVVYQNARSANDIKRMKERFRRTKKNQSETTVENVFRIFLNELEKEKAIANPAEERDSIPKKKNSTTNQSPKSCTERPQKDMKIEEQNIDRTDRNSHDFSNKMNEMENSEHSLSNIPMMETSQSSKPNNDKKERTKQKNVDHKNQDGSFKKEDTVEKCYKCNQTRLECTKTKEELNLEKKKVKSSEKKLEAKDKELEVFRKRETSIEETMKKKYEDELNEVNRKLKELTEKYTEEKSADSAKIHELEQTLEFRQVEVDRKVKNVTMIKNRELEEKDAIANSLKETIKKLNEQATSRDIFTAVLQENIRELKQQLDSKDLILQTIPDQIPSSSSSHQNQNEPSPSSPASSSADDVTTLKEKTPKEVIEDVLQRLKYEQEKVKKENSLKQERTTKLLSNFPGRDMSEWIKYEFSKFNINYEAYLKALDEQISLVEKVDELPPLPPAPGFSEKFMNMYNEVVKKEKELKAKNYTRGKPATSSRAPEELEDRECLICLEDMVDQDITLQCTSCSRRYHEQCLLDWLKKKRLCPTCDGGMLPSKEFPMPR